MHIGKQVGIIQPRMALEDSRIWEFVDDEQGVHTMGPRALLLTMAVSWFVASFAVAAAGDIDNGRTLARKHCAVCHVVGDYNKFGGIDSTPSFQLLAGLRDGEARFRTFFARRPHPSFIFLPDRSPPTKLPLNAPPVRLTHQQVEDIVNFALTLKTP